MLAAMGELNAMLRSLPHEIRGKVGGFFTLAKGGTGELRLIDSLTRRVEMIGRELERMLQHDYRSQILRMLERTKPKALNKVLRSRLEPDAQAYVDQVRAIAHMSEDESATADRRGDQCLVRGFPGGGPGKRVGHRENHCQVNSRAAFRYFFLQLSRQKYPGISRREILLMESPDHFHLLADLGQNTSRQRNRAVLLPLAVMHRHEHGIDIEALDAQFQAFRKPQATAIE